MRKVITACYSVNPLSLISTIVDEQNQSGNTLRVNPLSLISTIVDLCRRQDDRTRQSSFFNFYYCRSFPLFSVQACQSSFFNFYYCRSFSMSPPGQWVNPLSLISTIVDVQSPYNHPERQSSFFNFYYCRYRFNF